jgi:heme-degrading monooxygenase HmoA
MPRGAALCCAAVVTIGMNYQVLPGKEETFEAACQRVLEVMQGAAGHDSSAVYRRVDGGGSGGAEYLIASRWSDEAAFRAFLASDAFKKVTSWGLAHILAGRPSHTTYRED